MIFPCMIFPDSESLRVWKARMQRGDPYWEAKAVWAKSVYSPRFPLRFLGRVRGKNGSNGHVALKKFAKDILKCNQLRLLSPSTLTPTASLPLDGPWSGHGALGVGIWEGWLWIHLLWVQWDVIMQCAVTFLKRSATDSWSGVLGPGREIPTGHYACSPSLRWIRTRIRTVKKIIYLGFGYAGSSSLWAAFL